MISDIPGFRRGLRLGFVGGFVGGMVFTVLLWSPPAHGAEPDIGPPLAVATSADGSTVTLHKGKGVCVGDARAAVWRPGPGDPRAPVHGCWVPSANSPHILVSYLDGERGALDPARLKKPTLL